MLKSVTAFCLSRRAIVVFGLLAFAGHRVRRLQETQYRGISQPHAGHPGDHRAGAWPVRRGDGALLHNPIEIGLYTTPGIDVIRSTSFYGLSFVRVVFKYGVDYHFAYSQAAIAMQQNITLPGGQVPQSNRTARRGRSIATR